MAATHAPQCVQTVRHSTLIEKKTGALPLLLIDELESGLDEDALVRISEYIKNLKKLIKSY